MTFPKTSRFSSSHFGYLKLAVLSVSAILLVLTLTLAISAVASADNFTVSPVLPPTQNPDSQGFFDFTVTAGETQRIALEIGNTTSAPITVELTLATVVTNSNGIIDYTRSGEPDESMLHPFAEIASFGDINAAITVEPYSTTEIPIYIDIPDEGFDGIILGSVVALLGIPEEDVEDGGMFINRFQRVIAVRMQERDSMIEPEFLLGDVGAEVVNFRGAIVADVRNPMPRMVMGASVSAYVYHYDSGELLLSREGMGVDFAPNSFFPFILTSPDDRRISSGDFVARVYVEHDGVSWEFEREFTVVEELAQEINEVVAEVYEMPVRDEIVEEDLPWWERLFGDWLRNLLGDLPIVPVLSIVGGIILVLLIAIILSARSRRASRKAMKMMQDHLVELEERDRNTLAAVEALLAATSTKTAESEATSTSATAVKSKKPPKVKIKRSSTKKNN